MSRSKIPGLQAMNQDRGVEQRALILHGQSKIDDSSFSSKIRQSVSCEAAVRDKLGKNLFLD